MEKLRKNHKSEVTEMVRKHWLAHLPQDDKEAEERWEILRMTEDPIAIFKEVGLILPPLQYRHDADNLADALNVDQYVMDHEKKVGSSIVRTLIHTMIEPQNRRFSNEIEEIEHLLRQSTAPQIAVFYSIHALRTALATILPKEMLIAILVAIADNLGSQPREQG